MSDNVYSIISTVLTWDINELQKRAGKLEKERSGEKGKVQLHAIKAYPGMLPEDHKRIRHDSGKQIPLMVTHRSVAHVH